MPEKRVRTSDAFFVFCRWISKVFLRLYCRLEVVGRENIPESGGIILISNHASYLDPPIAGCELKRHMHSLAKYELFQVPILGWIVRNVKAHPIKRGQPDRAAMRECIDLVKDGGILLIFPEGTRSNDGEFQEAKAGAAMIAVQTEAPCVPLYIDGSYKAWPRSSALPRPSKIKIYYGPAFNLPEREGMAARDYYQVCADEMMRRIAMLKDQYCSKKAT